MARPLVLLLLLGCPEPQDSVVADPWADGRPPNPTCLAPERPENQWSVGLVASFGGHSFTRPVGMVPSPEADGVWTVFQQRGELFRASEDGGILEEMGTIPDVYMGSSELGLLGFAWHPNAAENRWAFVNYTLLEGDQVRTRVARLRADEGFTSFDMDALETLLTIDQPYENHNGGHLVFGPDGYLYIGVGDGGSAGDPQGNAQNRDVLLGKLLRIDVDGGAPYAIPADNPFAEGGGAPEVYAWGLRNPWRFFFDPESGALWLGDVGQGGWEELDLVELGGNYGWNHMEGAHCYRPAQDCETAGMILPVAEYGREGANKASIVGGPVYRGMAIPGLIGAPLFADVYSGTLSALVPDPLTGELLAEPIVPESGTFPVSFGQSEDGEVFVVDYSGTLSALVPNSEGSDAPAPFPERLSETGCFDPDKPTEPVAALFAYDVNSPLWSDGAEKRRWFALPDGSTLDVSDTGGLELPIGAVVVKEFRLGDKPVETRLLVRHEDGNWAGYTYQWRADGSDADLLPAGAAVSWGDQDWHYPSRGQCLACHTSLAGRTLGLSSAQLDRDYDYEHGATANQLDELHRVGLLSEPVTASAPLPDPAGNAPLDARARSYLATNCAVCHLPGGTGLGAIDLRYDTPLAETGACGTTPIHGDLDVEGALVLTPGRPEASVLSLRMHTLDANRMPGLGSHVVDPAGTALIDTWITDLAECP